MKKKNHIKMRFSTLLLCCLTIVLYAAPALQADETVPAGETWYIDYAVTGILWINGTANIQPGASVSQFIYVQDGGTLNMYSGTIGEKCFISVSSTKAGMTVYGTDFEDDLGPVDYGQWTPDVKETLTGQYTDGSPINLMFYCDTPINLQPPPSGIDIKPGSDDNSINLKSMGVVPVAVFTIADGLDAGTIDPGTVKFAGAGPPIRWKICDVDDDGDKDMLFHFKTQELVELDEDSIEATLTGKTFGGKDIELTDEVRIVQSKKE